ncbi:MAG: twin-arginine translocase TatA/TatE family subunit [Bacillota bacterium]
MFGILPNIGPTELIVVLVIVLVIFGPGKLPQVGKSIGNTIREFRKASSNLGIVENSEEKQEEQTFISADKK